MMTKAFDELTADQKLVLLVYYEDGGQLHVDEALKRINAAIDEFGSKEAAIDGIQARITAERKRG